MGIEVARDRRSLSRPAIRSRSSGRDLRVLVLCILDRSVSEIEIEESLDCKFCTLYKVDEGFTDAFFCFVVLVHSERGGEAAWSR